MEIRCRQGMFNWAEGFSGVRCFDSSHNWNGANVMVNESTLSYDDHILTGISVLPNIHFQPYHNNKHT